MRYGLIRRCPKCSSLDVSRSRRRSTRERLMVLLLLRPFHCWHCNHRYFGFLFSRRAEVG